MIPTHAWRVSVEIESEDDARALAAVLRQLNPDSPISLEEAVPAGGWDPVQQVNWDGWRWEPRD